MLRLDELAPSGLAKAHSGVERRAVWAGWTTVPGDEEATRQLWSQRVAYFAAVFLALSAALICAMRWRSRCWSGRGRPCWLRRSCCMPAALGVHGAQWFVCRSGKARAAALDRRRGAAHGDGVVRSRGGGEQLRACGRLQSAGAEVYLTALIMLGITLTHAVIVLLDVQATFWLSSACCAIGVATAYLVSQVSLPAELLAAKPWLPASQAIFVSVWAPLAVTVSSIAARIIHGLQQRVRDANEIGQYVLEERIGEGGMGVV